MNIFPYRARFSKRGRMRFLSHHDVLRLWERALRRSELPLRLSEGFNPHPILAFPTALPLGVESEDEVLEFELSTWVAPKVIEAKLAAQLPEGIGVRDVEPFTRRDRSQIDFMEYEAVLPSAPADLDARIAGFLEKKELVIGRKREHGEKPVEIRRYVMALERDGNTILMRIKHTDTGTARPDEVLAALGLAFDASIRLVKSYTEVLKRDR